MNRTRWFVMSLVVPGLMVWAGAFAQDNADEKEVKIEREVEIEGQGPDVKMEQETKIEHETKIDQERPAASDQRAMRDADIAGQGQLDTQRRLDPQARDLRSWANQPRGAFQQDVQGEQRQASRVPATQPMMGEMERPQAARVQGPLVDQDIFIFEEGGPSERYWTGSQSDIYGFRGEREHGFAPSHGQLYGFAGDERRAGGVQGAVITPTPTDEASSDWSEGRNLVDDNYMQNRDEFEVDRDFYTKEWKVSGPPLVAHPRFQTIYDNDFTNQYYTSWHGAPVLWSANAMTPTPMPQTRNQWLSSRQMVTYFDWWDDKDISNTPTTFSTRTGPYRGEGMAFRESSAGVYGYAGFDQPGASQMTRDGTIRQGGQALYWDDQDLLESGTVGARSDIYGFVSPDGQISGSPGATTEVITGDLHLNIPRGTAVDIYGVPGGASPTATIERETEYGTYGYVGEGEREVKVEEKTKVEKRYKDKDCDDHYKDRQMDSLDQ